MTAQAYNKNDLSVSTFPKDGYLPHTSSKNGTTLISSSDSTPSITVGAQKVRFNLEPIPFHDTKRRDENRSSKHLRLENLHLTTTAQDFFLRKSPSDPTISFIPPTNRGPIPDQLSLKKKNNIMSVISPKSSHYESRGESETPPPELPPRERKVRFQTKLSDSETSSDDNVYRTLPRNHRTQFLNQNLYSDESFDTTSVKLDCNEMCSNVEKECNRDEQSSISSAYNSVPWSDEEPGYDRNKDPYLSSDCRLVVYITINGSTWP